MMKRPPPHLALFIYRLSAGGAQRRTVTLANAFASRGCRVDLVVVDSSGPLRAALTERVRLFALDRKWPWLPWIWLRASTWTWASMACLRSYLRCELPDVVLSAASHVNRAALRLRRAGRLQPRLVVRVSSHASRSAVNPLRRRRPRRLRQTRRLYPLADAVIAVSDGVADDLSRLAEIPRQRITTIYNPIVTPALLEAMRAPLEHSWFEVDSAPVILGAGGLKAQKDFPTLLRAFARVRGVRPARLMIMGEGKKRRQLQALAHELGIAGDVDLPGFVENPLPYMVRAAVFCLSSAWEGLPGVLIEALACGCPVVSTDCPSGPAEILDRGAYGSLVPVGDDEAMAAAILRVLDTPADRSVRRARAAEFSLDRAVDRYMEALLGTPLTGTAGLGQLRGRSALREASPNDRNSCVRRTHPRPGESPMIVNMPDR